MGASGLRRRWRRAERVVEEGGGTVAVRSGIAGYDN